MIGATGLVGGLLSARLARNRTIEVHALVRRRSGRREPGYHEHVAAPERWPDIVSALRAESAISALGTTMRLAGSKAAFRAVDLEMVLAFARAAHEAGARHMLSISSVGADPNASSFYLRTKGELEQSLWALGFERLDLLRPGLLKGKRGGPIRVAERFAILLSPLTGFMLRGALNRYAAIDAEAVAAAAAYCLGKGEPGFHVHHNDDLRRLASALQR